MKIVCPQCNASYSVPENRIPERKASFPCKRCGKKIIFDSRTSKWADRRQGAAAQSGKPEAAQPAPRHDGAVIREFPEVQALSPERFALGQLLPPDKKGRYRTRLNKFKLKLLDGVKSALVRMLEKDEQVLHLAGATAYYPAELFFGNGWLTVLYNRYVLVATTRRLIAINTDYKMRKPTHYFFQFPYNEMKKVSRGFFGGRLILTPKKGKRRIFNGIKAGLSAEIKKYIDTKIDPDTVPVAITATRGNLCPGCFAPLGAKLASCPACGAQFKSPRKAALRSLLLPGLGDVYLGHRFLGSCEMLGSLIVWLVLLSSLFSGDSAALAVVLVFFLFYHGMDGLLTLHMAKKGYSLDTKQAQTDFSGRVSPSQA